MQQFDHVNWFSRKNANFFRRKLENIAENCDHNIDPRSRYTKDSWAQFSKQNQSFKSVFLCVFTAFVMPVTRVVCNL
jgi:hypothetical protein